MDLTTEDNNMDFSTTITTDSTTSSDIFTAPEIISISRSRHNASLVNVSQQFHNESQFVQPIFEGFIAAGLFMITLELVIACIASYKISSWRRNYRNQMLMQLSVARFIKRLVIYVDYLSLKGVIVTSSGLEVTLIFSQIYIDHVISILVCFFIKHMYDSLIIVIVKISRGNLRKALWCSWLIPIPVSAMWTSIIATGVLDEWWSYLLGCCLFRWPVMFVSTAIYVIVLYRVLRDAIRRYARSLTVVTFFLCLFVNLHLLFRDIILLSCLKSFSTELISNVLGFGLNSVVLCLYIVLITLNYHSDRKQNNYSNAERSIANAT